MEEKKRPTRIRPKTSDSGESSKEKQSPNTTRVLRKRRVDLNGLAKDPLVCQFQYCGIQLTDFETLEVMHNVNDMTIKLHSLEIVENSPGGPSNFFTVIS